MFDLDVSLFILSMWITIICYFTCSHVKHVNYYYKFDSSPDDSGYTKHIVIIQK